LAGRILRLVATLPEHAAGRHVANQLARCGTAVGAHYEEARAAESRRDFLHKLRIGSKELQESRYWIRVVVEAGWTKPNRVSPLLDEIEQLNRVLGKSVSTAKRNERASN
jgi:four helix bundle protein